MFKNDLGLESTAYIFNLFSCLIQFVYIRKRIHNTNCKIEELNVKEKLLSNAKAEGSRLRGHRFKSLLKKLYFMDQSVGLRHVFIACAVIL
jgi:hypothetical protein